MSFGQFQSSVDDYVVKSCVSPGFKSSKYAKNALVSPGTGHPCLGVNGPASLGESCDYSALGFQNESTFRQLDAKMIFFRGVKAVFYK